jgi:hypothetical protein
MTFLRYLLAAILVALEIFYFSASRKSGPSSKAGKTIMIGVIVTCFILFGLSFISP